MIDVTTLLKAVDLKNLAEQAGARFTGNRSHCPLHRGNNRSAFSVYQGQDGIWRYHCHTGCDEGANGGNAITFYMHWKGCDFKTATADLQRIAGVAAQTTERAPAEEPASIKPSSVGPSEAWRKRAAQFCAYAQDKLGASTLDYLMRRGLTPETIKYWGLGYNPAYLRDTSSRWGLDGDCIYLASGWVIPHKRHDGIWFVNIRRPGDVKPKYMGPRGGVRGWFGEYTGAPVAMLAEGEFDTMLAWQSAGDLCDIGTLGGARHRLSMDDAEKLLGAEAIICAYDVDVAGDLGAAYMRKVFGSRLTTARPDAHDLTDYWKAGYDLRRWIAGRVCAALESAIDRIDQNKSAALFTRVMEAYNRASDAK